MLLKDSLVRRKWFFYIYVWLVVVVQAANSLYSIYGDDSEIKRVCQKDYETVQEQTECESLFTSAQLVSLVIRLSIQIHFAFVLLCYKRLLDPGHSIQTDDYRPGARYDPE